MSAVARLGFLTHAMTDAVQAARFPADEPLNPLGLRTAERFGGLPATFRPDLIQVGPEVRAEQTAKALGLPGTTDPGLRDIDHGSWSGKSLDDLPPDQLMGWMTDPEFRAHGGESVTGLLDRVRDWMNSAAARPHQVLAVTHPAIVRAAILIALDAPPISFWRIDIEPLTLTTLHRRGPGWTLRGSGRPL